MVTKIIRTRAGLQEKGNGTIRIAGQSRKTKRKTIPKGTSDHHHRIGTYPKTVISAKKRRRDQFQRKDTQIEIKYPFPLSREQNQRRRERP